MKTITQVFKEAKVELEETGVDTPVLDARLLVQHATGMTHEDLLLNSKKIVTDSELKTLSSLVERRKNREPVSRIVGHRAFWKSDFKVSRETLDPRHDSETIIETALRFFPSSPRKRGSPADLPEIPAYAGMTVLDLGTGTGCLLLSLLQEWQGAKGTGLDISADAVKTASENAEMLGLSSRAVFTMTDWENYRPEQPFDVVISNPPYIAESEIPTLAPEVRDHDPLQALVAGKDGLDAYRIIVKRLPGLLKSGGMVFFEIGSTQANDVKDLLAKAGFDVIQVVPDLAGHDRVVVAKRP